MDKLHRSLHAQLVAAGCFRKAPLHAFIAASLILGGYASAYFALLTDPGPELRAAALIAAAFFTVQAGFLGHEASHGAITRRRALAEIIGQIFQTLLGALSYSYFRATHRQHHPHSNDRSRDPDMQSGFVSLYRESACEKRGLGRLTGRYQAVLIWMLVWLQGFTLKFENLHHVNRNLRTSHTEQALLAAHYALWLAPPTLTLGIAATLVNYGILTALIGFYTGAVLLVNHIGTRVIEPGESLSHFEHQLAVTRNLGSSRLQDIFFGGVNHHIEHHLFPSIPTARLRIARAITREFCRRHGIAYREMSWLAAACEVTRHLQAITDQQMEANHA